ncbi:MAG: response regulator [Bacteroidales bacterium]|nr:response regulator [Bacteroidales bacterium]
MTLFVRILKKTAKNARDALKIIENDKIDLIFLDINMPGNSDLDLFQSI